ncbi:MULTISPECIES: hypothetical protein [unclassified Agarivorans]|uniref:hypothetical protein n=1 Tax=unclassified Agarivorans TaxID=2636026 RepID=UPI003D7E6239
MPSVYSTLFFSLISCASLAFLLLMLVLYKGQLCPGQTGRIQRQLGTLVSLITLAALSSIESQQSSWLSALILVAAFAGWALLFQLNKLKHKRSLKLKLWWFMGIPMLAAGLVVLNQQPLFLFTYLVCATALAHWLMVKAKHRLSQFDKVLPCLGIVSAMLSILCLCVYLLAMPQLSQDPQQIKQFVIVAILLTLAVLLWLAPQFKKQSPPASLLLVVVVLSFTSSLAMQGLAT